MCSGGGGYSGNPSIGLSPVTQRRPLSDPTAKTTVNSAAVHNAQSSQQSVLRGFVTSSNSGVGG